MAQFRALYSVYVYNAAVIDRKTNLAKKKKEEEKSIILSVINNAYLAFILFN